jgi:predicted dehydrogenase
MINIGIIGCGAITRHAHLPAWLGNPAVRVVGLCDQNEAAMAMLVNRHHLDCKTHTRLEDMLSGSQVDVLDICTPGHLHYEHAYAGLQAGCHILIEKPPVMSLVQAEDLLNLGQTVNRKVGTILNFRYYDIMQEAKKAIDSGLVGNITKVALVHHAGNIYSENAFLWNERESKYLLYDFGIHFLDAMIFLAGPVKKVEHVWARTSVYSGETTDLHVLWEYESGAIGSFEITCDFTLHSSHITHVTVFGTGMDMFIRRFPASVRLAAGIHNPFEILVSECRAIWRIASKLLTGKYLRWRNISHERVFALYTDWLEGKGEYPMKLSDCMATLRLLDEIEAMIPAYSGRNKLDGSHR